MSFKNHLESLIGLKSFQLEAYNLTSKLIHSFGRQRFDWNGLKLHQQWKIKFRKLFRYRWWIKSQFKLQVCLETIPIDYSQKVFSANWRVYFDMENAVIEIVAINYTVGEGPWLKEEVKSRRGEISFEIQPSCINLLRQKGPKSRNWSS